MIDPDRLTVKAQQALAEAQSLAQSMDHQEVDVEHLLYALVVQPEVVVAPLLQKGFDPLYGARPLKRVIQRVKERTGQAPENGSG